MKQRTLMITSYSMLPLRFPVLTVLDEANVLGVAAEALPAAHQPVLPDQAMRVAADTAATTKIQTTTRHKPREY